MAIFRSILYITDIQCVASFGMPKTNEKPSFRAAKHTVLVCKIDYLRVQERLFWNARLTILGCKTDYLAS